MTDLQLALVVRAEADAAKAEIDALVATIDALKAEIAALSSRFDALQQEMARAAADAGKVATSIREVGSTATAADGPAQKVAEALARIADQSRRMAETTSASVRAAIADFQRLEAQTDATYAAALRYAQAQDRVAAALKAGAITQMEATRALAAAKAELDDFVSQAGTAATGSGDLSGQVQNAAFQVQDFAVQVAAGTSAITALAQQLPQMLGGFGVWGAAIGAVVAVLGALLPLLLSAKEETRDLADVLADAAAAQRATDEAMKAAREPLEALRLKYGEVTDAVLANIAAQVRAAKVAEEAGAGQAFDEIIRKIGAIIGGYTDATTALNAAIETAGQQQNSPQSISGVEGLPIEVASGGLDPAAAQERLEAALARVRDETNLSAEAVQALQDAWRDYRGTADQDFATQAAGLATIRDTIAATEEELATLPEPMQQLYAQTVEAIRIIQTLGRSQEENAAKAQTLIAQLEAEAAIRDAVAQYGEDSVEATGLRVEAERAAFQAQVETLGVSEELSAELLSAWDRARGIEATDMRSGIAAARAEAEGMADALAAAVARAADLSRQAKTSLLTRIEEAQIRIDNAKDPIATARALEEAQARRQLDIVNPILPDLPDPDAFIAAREAEIAERGRLAAEAARREQNAREVNTPARKPSGGGTDKAEKEAKRLATQAEREHERAILDVGRAIDRLAPSYDRDVAAAEAWKAKTLAALDESKAGHAEHAAEVEQAFDLMLADAYDRDLDRRTDWEAGVLRGLKRIREESADMARLSEDVVKDIAGGFEDFFTSIITGTKSAGDAFRDFGNLILQQVARIASQRFTSSVVNPLLDALMGGIGGLFGTASPVAAPVPAITPSLGGLVNFTPFAKGGVPNAPALSQWSNQIVDQPTFFAFAQGAAMGVMGEAGEEAIMPLRRGPDGRLGVDAAGGAGNPVTVNVINNAAGTKAETRERTEGGSRIVDVMIEQVKAAIAGDITRGAGPIPGALAATFGLNRVAR